MICQAYEFNDSITVRIDKLLNALATSRHQILKLFQENIKSTDSVSSFYVLQTFIDLFTSRSQEYLHQ